MSQFREIAEIQAKAMVDAMELLHKAMELESAECALPECDERFVVGNNPGKPKKYCCRRHLQTAKKREYRRK